MHENRKILQKYSIANAWQSRTCSKLVRNSLDYIPWRWIISIVYFNRNHISLSQCMYWCNAYISTSVHQYIIASFKAFKSLAYPLQSPLSIDWKLTRKTILATYNGKSGQSHVNCGDCKCYRSPYNVVQCSSHAIIILIIDRLKCSFSYKIMRHFTRKVIEKFTV